MMSFWTNSVVRWGLLFNFLFAGLTTWYLWQKNHRQYLHNDSALHQFLETIDLRFNDIKFRWKGTTTHSPNIVLVAVDDESIQEIGRWPWGRDVMTQVFQTVLSYEPAALAMDVIFSEPERYAPQNDQALAQTVGNHSEKFILGAFSNNQIHPKPYQDYCVNEAFLQTGGEHIVKLNVSLVVDDAEDRLETLNWRGLFSSLFSTVQDEVEVGYLKEIGATSKEDLSDFQKNYLRSLKIESLFSYCQNWLTDQDELLRHYKDQMSGIYENFFSPLLSEKSWTVKQQIEWFKEQALPLTVPQYGYWQGNLPALQEASEYTASFVAQLDHDGYVRSYPLFYRSGNKIGTSYMPSLALQTYLVAKGYRADVQLEQKEGRKVISSFKIMDPSTTPEQVISEVPLDDFGRMTINYYGPSFTLPYVSAKDFFSKDPHIYVKSSVGKNQYGQLQIGQKKVLKSEFFKGKSVLFGATSTAIYDIRNTPVSANYPGPEIHLTALSNLEQKDFIRTLPNELVILPLSLFLLGAIITLFLAQAGAFSSMLSLLGFLAVLFTLDQLLFTKYSLLSSSVFSLLHVFLLHFLIFLFKFFSEEKKKNEVKKAFSKYVAPAVVEELLKSEDNIELGGTKRELSVFFSDVRGFTSFSEKMDPQELSELLNSYLTPMTRLIFEHRGTLDKYMGDGLMAFFGAPIEDQNHALHACQCALESFKELGRLQDVFREKGWPPIDIGIGINSGPMSVGNMGSEIVQSYTVLGDAVNLGARLESATKGYGVKILVGEETYERAKDHLLFREVDRVRVKGKLQPVRAYELMLDQSTNSKAQVLDFQKAYKAYHEKNFENARDLLSQAEAKYPEDGVVKVYQLRTKEFLINPPPQNWDGVFERRTK